MNMDNMQDKLQHPMNNGNDNFQEIIICLVYLNDCNKILCS